MCPRRPRGEGSPENVPAFPICARHYPNVPTSDKMCPRRQRRVDVGTFGNVPTSGARAKSAPPPTRRGHILKCAPVGCAPGHPTNVPTSFPARSHMTWAHLESTWTHLRNVPASSPRSTVAHFFGVPKMCPRRPCEKIRDSRGFEKTVAGRRKKCACVGRAEREVANVPTSEMCPRRPCARKTGQKCARASLFANVPTSRFGPAL